MADRRRSQRSFGEQCSLTRVLPTVGDRIAQMVVKQLIEPIWILSSCRTPMATARENRLWMPWASRVSGAGNMTGF